MRFMRGRRNSRSVSLPGSRMGAVVDHFQLRGGQLRVTLRGGEPFVAEQLLNGSQVGALFQQMRSEGVA